MYLCCWNCLDWNMRIAHIFYAFYLRSLIYFFWRCLDRTKKNLLVSTIRACDVLFHNSLGKTIFRTFTQNYASIFVKKYTDIAQRPRIDLNKRFLLRPKTTTAWNIIPHRSKISKNWNPPHWIPLNRFFKNCFLLIQKQHYSNYIQTHFT